MHKCLPTLLLSTMLGPVLSAQEGHPARDRMSEDRAKGAAAVSVEDTRAWIAQLASPEFAGRGTGQDGFRKAAEFVRDHFAALGLEPGAGDGSWFQDLPWTQSEPDVGQAKLTFTRGDRQLAIPGERLSGSVTTALQASGGIALVTTTDEALLQAAELDGKVVVLALPSQADGTGADTGRGRGRGRGGPLFAVLRALQGKHTAAVLVAQPEPASGGLTGRSAPAGNRAARGSRMFPAVVTFGGDDLQALLQLAGRQALPTEPGVSLLEVDAQVDVPVSEHAAPACNVIGVLRGSDPARAGEYVVVGSHLDHLGRRGGQYYPGADDDGSGTTGVMAVAQMLVRNPLRPARSVLLVCFCGEELGLLGSRWFAQHPPIPLESIVGELQMDMIGRDEEEARDGGRLVNEGETAADNRNSLHLVGTQKLAPELHALCLDKNAAAGFDLEWDQESMFSRSDHANFARMGVPIAFFFTGLHRDYHQLTDTPDKIHYEKLLRVATYVYDIAFELAQQPGRPRIDPELWDAYRGKGRTEPAAPMLDGKDD